MSRRSRAVLSALTALIVCSFATADAQPQQSGQSIKLIVQAAAGGLPDTVARIVGRQLQERMGQSVVVENRPGANGGVAAAMLLNSPADGHSFLITDGSVISINPVIYSTLGYNPKDLMPVVLLARAPLFLAAHPKVSVKTMKEFVDYVHANPGKLNYGSSGVGSTHHLSMEAVKAALKLEMTHIPYKGTGESVPALLGGHVEFAFSAYPSLSGAIESKRVNLLATNGPTRSAQAPDAPPIADFIPGFDFAPIIGFLARSGTPPALIQRIAKESAEIVKMPEVIKQFATAGIEPVGAGPDDYGRALKNEVGRVADVVRAANIKPQ